MMPASDVERLSNLICDRVRELWPVEAEANPENLKANGTTINQYHTQTVLEFEFGMLYQRGRCASDQQFIACEIDPKIAYLKHLYESSSLLALELPKGVT